MRSVSPDRLGELMAEKASKITRSESSGVVRRVPERRIRGRVPRARTGSQRDLAYSDRAGHCTVGRPKLRSPVGRGEGVCWA